MHIFIYVDRELLDRANEWLENADPSVKLISCEALDVEGIYESPSDDNDVQNVTVNSASQMIPAFMRVLR